MPEYYPENYYQDQISSCEEIISYNADISNIDIPDSEENSSEVEQARRRLSNSSSHIDNHAYSLLELIKYQIQKDLENHLKKYVEDVSSEYTEENFPFDDWHHCATFKKGRWHIDINWLKEANNFDLNTENKNAIFLENILIYLNTVSRCKDINFTKQIQSIKDYIDNKAPQHENFYQYLLCGKEYDYLQCVREKKLPSAEKLQGWSYYASILLHQEIIEGKNDLLIGFKNYLDITNDLVLTQKEIKNFVKVIFNINVNLPYSKGKNLPQMFSYDINWEALKNLSQVFSIHDINIQSQLNEEIEERMIKHYHTSAQEKVMVGYKDFLCFINALNLDKTLSTNIDKKNVQKI